MFTPQWFLVLLITVAIGAIGTVISVVLFKVPWRWALFAWMMFNCFPVMTPIIAKTPLYFPDLLVPFLAIYVFRNRRGALVRVGILAIVVLFLFPSAATLMGKASGLSTSNAWMTQIFRNFVLLTCYAFGIHWGQRVRPSSSFFDAGMVFWCMIMVVGFVQAQGLIDTDIVTDVEERGLATSVTEGVSALRGYMGYWRASAGMMAGSWAMVAAAFYCLGRSDGGRAFLYPTVIILGIAALVYTGSRTALLAFAVAGCYFGFVLLNRFRYVRETRLAAVGLAAVLVVPLLVAPALFVLEERYSTRNASPSLASRIEVQRETLEAVLSSPRGILIGFGGGSSSDLFRSRSDLSVAHSEYVQVVWDSGVLVWGLYMVFLCTLFWRMRPRAGIVNTEHHALATAGRSVWIAGAVAGLATGNLVVTSARMYTNSCLFLMTFGIVVGQLAAESHRRRARPRSRDIRSESGYGAVAEVLQ